MFATAAFTVQGAQFWTCNLTHYTFSTQRSFATSAPTIIPVQVQNMDRAGVAVAGGSISHALIATQGANTAVTFTLSSQPRHAVVVTLSITPSANASVNTFTLSDQVVTIAPSAWSTNQTISIYTPIQSTLAQVRGTRIIRVVGVGR